MRAEIHAYLDGEIGLDQLPVELRAEAERWERLLNDAWALGPAGAPPGLASEVERALADRLAGRSTWRRAADWLIHPRSIRVSPLAGLAAAAVLAFLVLRVGLRSPAPGTTAAPTVYVQFSVQAPTARAVSVAGDFNEWSPDIQLQDVDGDGVWTGRVAVRPGVHQYMFVLDGQWVTDPNAQRYVDDGFGHRNAVMVVAPTADRS